MEHIRQLLKDNDLPYEDLRSSRVAVITYETEGQLIGCIGLEAYGEDGLLRSFAVQKGHKGKGIGKQLLAELIHKSKNQGIKTLHLLTTTADRYFIKHGFLIAERSHAPEAILNSTEFSEICPASSIYMVMGIE